MKYKYLTHVNNNPTKPHFRRSIVGVELFGPTGKIETIALVDSGADSCLFNLQYAKSIGVDIEKCEVERTMGIEGAGKEVYMTELEIQVKNLDRVMIPIGFIDSRSVSSLLGQNGFFDLHRIKFERDHNTFEINPIK